MPREDQGAFHDRYRVIPRTLIFLTSGDSVLLLKGKPTKRLWANLYNGIGGHIERGEDALSAAYRELQEETGLSEVSLRLAGVILIDAETDTGIGIYVFRGEVADQPALESPEGTLEWVEYAQLNNISLVEDLPLLLPLVLNQDAQGARFFGIYRYNEKNQLEVKFRLEDEQP